MLESATRRRSFENDPFVAALLHVIREIHGASGAIAVLGANFNLCGRLVAGYRELCDSDFHIGHVEALYGGKMLDHTRLDGFFIIGFGLATDIEEQRQTEKAGQKSSKHSNFLSLSETN